MPIFTITLKQVAILIAYILLGYLLTRKKLIPKETNKTFSKLLIYVFAPAYTIPKLAKQIDSAYIMSYLWILLAGITVAVVCIFLAKLCSRFFAERGYERNIYKYMFAFSNLGYFGYPLVNEVFGEAALANFMLFTLPMSVALNSYGYIVLTSDGTEEKQHGFHLAPLLKKIFSIPFLTSLIGIILGLLPITLPDVFFDVLAPAGNCYSVIAMLMAGISLASYPVKNLFSGIKPYFASAVRLILIPFIMGGVVFALYKLLNFDKNIVICTVAFSALPSGMNVVVFPEFVGKDGSVGAKACFISCILSLITIPLWFYLLSVLIPI